MLIPNNSYRVLEPLPFRIGAEVSTLPNLTVVIFKYFYKDQKTNILSAIFVTTEGRKIRVELDQLDKLEDFALDKIFLLLPDKIQYTKDGGATIRVFTDKPKFDESIKTLQDNNYVDGALLGLTDMQVHST